MKLNHLYLFFFGIVLIGCSAADIKKPKRYKECAQNYKNDFAEVTQEKYIAIHNKDTLSYTEIKYQCTSSSLYNLRTMYGYYGKWHKHTIPSNSKKPLLIWENVDLLSDGQKYNVITFGDEIARDDISTSVMIFDINGNDMLKDENEFKNRVVEFFANNIRNNSNTSKEFYHEYLKEFNPEHWKKYKKSFNIN